MGERHVGGISEAAGRERGAAGLGAEVRASAVLIALAVLATAGVALLAHLLLGTGS